MRAELVIPVTSGDPCGDEAGSRISPPLREEKMAASSVAFLHPRTFEFYKV